MGPNNLLIIGFRFKLNEMSSYKQLENLIGLKDNPIKYDHVNQIAFCTCNLLRVFSTLLRILDVVVFYGWEKHCGKMAAMQDFNFVVQ